MSNVNSQMMTSDKQLYGACFRNRFPRIISEVAEVGLFKQKKKEKKKVVSRQHIFGFLASVYYVPRSTSVAVQCLSFLSLCL